MQHCNFNIKEVITRNLMPSLWSRPDTITEQMHLVMWQIVEGLSYLHSHSYPHGDLNPIKVYLVCAPDDPIAKITGVGIQSMHPDDQGTLGYRAPEVIDGRPPTQASDMYSLRCIFYYCITGDETLFGEKYYTRDTTVVNNSFSLQRLNRHPQANDLIFKLLAPLPQNRPDSTAAERHPMFWNHKKRVDFFQHAHGVLQLHSGFLSALENDFVHHFNRWDRRFSQVYITNMSQRVWYMFNLVQDLIRLFRNSSAHYLEIQANPL